MIRKDSRKRDNQAWTSQEIKEGIKLIFKNASKVAKISGNLEDWEIFKGQQKAKKKAVKKSKIDYESKLAQNIKTDSKRNLSMPCLLLKKGRAQGQLDQFMQP